MRTVFIILVLSIGFVWAHEPEGGYPTTERQFENCCHDEDCWPQSVEVHWINKDLRRVVWEGGAFRVHRTQAHQITNFTAQEHICTKGGSRPQPNGQNVYCVFYKVGMW